MKKITIIGTGPAALILAAHLDTSRYAVTMFEKNAAPGRKFLVAGDGGLNLTHGEELRDFISRYTPKAFMDPVIRAFTPGDLCAWLGELGVPTYMGSSKHIFPDEDIKPIDVLNRIVDAAEKNKVVIHKNHTWTGWNENGQLLFQNKNGETVAVETDITVFALGGASWPVTGADGAWTSLFEARGISCLPFEASNCAVHITWPAAFVTAAEGQVLKGVTLTCGNASRRGDVVIKASGVEGSPVYFHAGNIRKQLKEKGHATLFVDLQPNRDAEGIDITFRRLSKKSRADILRHLGLSNVAIQLLKTHLTKDDFLDNIALGKAIKQFELTVTATGPVEDAISTVGGLPLTAINKQFEIKNLPGSYAIGEMLDWDAPTGGYLLQGCFSMGFQLAGFLNELKE
jgi:uncharacterized flavoprotein (TIGR03862 family)